MARRREEPLDLSALELPTHVAIIMDGNGRWARKRGLPRQAGHRAGAENLRRIIRACVSKSSTSEERFGNCSFLHSLFSSASSIHGQACYSVCGCWPTSLTLRLNVLSI